MRKSIFLGRHLAAAVALCAALALAAPALASSDEYVDWIRDVMVKIPEKTDVPLDAETLESIRADRKYSYPMVESPAWERNAGPDELDYYQASFQPVFINYKDQWKGWLTRYRATKEADGSISLRNMGDLNDDIKDLSYIYEDHPRNVMYWSFEQNKFVELTMDNVNGEFARTTKMNEMIVRSLYKDPRLVDVSYDWDLRKTYARYPYDEYKPADAYLQWLAAGRDFSYMNAAINDVDESILIARQGGMPDMGQCSFVVNGPPEAHDSLPGYKEWAEMNADRPTYLYVQTNDGILHVAKPEANIIREVAALIPPSSMLPGRLASVKTHPTGEWWDIAREMDLDRSRAVYLLDGSLQLRHFDLKGRGDPNDWGTYLIGTLGRAGNGIYMMDVSDPADPQLMWYRETIHEYTDAGNNRLRDNVTTIYLRDGVLDVETFDDIDWQREDPLNTARFEDKLDPSQAFLGYNIPKPGTAVIGHIDKEPGKTDLRSIIVVGGGTKSCVKTRHSSAYDASCDVISGVEGSAIYVLDARTGETLMMYNSHSDFVNDVPGRGVGEPDAKMGMMISEPTFLRTRDSRYIASSAFLCSVNGCIFMVRFGDEAGVSSTDPKKWRIAELAEVIPRLERTEGMPFEAIPHGVAITRLPGEKDDIWVAGVTADVFSRRDMGGEADLSNYEQFIFGFESTAEPHAGEFVKAAREYMQRVDKNDDAAIFTHNPADQVRPKGWYSLLDEADGRYGAEYGTARPLIVTYKGRQIALVATYKQSKTQDPSVSDLYALDVETGGPALWSDGSGGKTKAKSFTGVKITGLTLSDRGGRKSVIVTFDKTEAGDDVADRMSDETFLHKTGGRNVDAFVIDLGTSSNAKTSLKPGTSVMEYWMVK